MCLTLINQIWDWAWSFWIGLENLSQIFILLFNLLTYPALASYTIIFCFLDFYASLMRSYIVTFQPFCSPLTRDGYILYMVLAFQVPAILIRIQNKIISHIFYHRYLVVSTDIFCYSDLRMNFEGSSVQKLWCS